MASRTLPGLGLTGFWDLGSGGWKTGMDDNLRVLSAIVQGTALSRTTALPGSPTDGDIYIVPIGADADKVAIRDNGAWVYVVPKEGWQFWIVDTEELVRYDGADWIVSTAVGDLADLGDVDFTTPPADGQALVYNNVTSKWNPATLIKTYAALTDVDWTTPATDGQIMAWENATSKWVPIDPPSGGGSTTLAALTDVDVTTPPTNGQALVYNNVTSKWNPATLIKTYAALTDVDWTTPATDGQIMKWNNATSKWVPVNHTLATLTDVDLTGLANGDLLKYVSATGKWEKYTPPAQTIGLSFYIGSTIDNSEVVFSFIPVQNFQLPIALAGSHASATVAAAASTVFNIKKNGANVGTITFAAAGTVATLAMAAATSFTGADTMTIVGPASADATLANLTVSLLGTLT